MGCSQAHLHRLRQARWWECRPCLPLSVRALTPEPSFLQQWQAHQWRRMRNAAKGRVMRWSLSYCTCRAKRLWEGDRRPERGGGCAVPYAELAGGRASQRCRPRALPSALCCGFHALRACDATGPCCLLAVGVYARACVAGQPCPCHKVLLVLHSSA